MAQTSFALMTNLGRSKEAAALANGQAVVITHIAIGDGVTVPSGGETQLYNEIDRKPIIGHGTVSGALNTAYFDTFLAAADGPYTIREAGLIDEDGDMIAVARYDPAINKPIPSSGQTVEGTLRLEIAFSNAANIIIVVDPSMSVPMQKLTVLPWIPVISMTVTAPPVGATPGQVYVIPVGATGAWAGYAHRIAELTPAGWALISPPNGHGIGLPDGSEFIRVNGVYRSKSHFARLADADIPVKGWQSAPPASPAEGDRYVVKSPGTGAWATRNHQIAAFIGGAWAFSSPIAGLQVQYWSGRQIVLRFDGATWAEDIATATAHGRAKKATQAEVDAGLLPDAFVSPETFATSIETHRSRLNADVTWPATTFKTIGFNDTGDAPSFATLANGVYTLTRGGSYMVVAQVMHNNTLATSLNIYWDPVGAATEQLLGTNQQTTGTGDNGLFAACIIPGMTTNPGDKIDIRAYMGGSGTGRQVYRKSPSTPSYTEVTITRIGN